MKKILFLLPFIALAGCTSTTVQNQGNPVTNTNVATATTSAYTTNQVSQHSSRSDCWVIYQNNVYNITQFAPQHPGGDQIYQACGQDITTYMQTQHKPISSDIYTPYLIGKTQ